MPRRWLAATTAALLRAAAGLSLLDLRDAPWQLSSGNGSVRVRAANASNVHLSLMDAGVLQGDPYYRYNELEWSWVAREAWRYERGFRAAPEVLAEGSHVLRCQVDTVAEIRLNGQLIGETSNMFLEYAFDVGGVLEAENSLEVLIKPALDYGAKRASEYPYAVPQSVYYHDWAEGASPDFDGWGNGSSTHRSFVRKAPSDFGWDWGPAFVPSGVAQLELVSGSLARLAGLKVRQRHGPRSVVLALEARWSAAADCRASLTATLARPGGKGAFVVERNLSIVGQGEGSGDLEVEVADPELWWPVGFGEQPLYELHVRLRAVGANGLVEESSLRRRVGLRTAELVQEEEEGGSTFFFRVNGVDIFAKGSNFIPPDVFAPRAAREFEWILRSAAEANMNMVRVWGGGVYQADEFYDLADELGIMIWQEMVFACSLYPRDKAFLASVAREIEQQALRLHHHASIVVWGGNNENEGAIEWYKLSSAQRDLYVVDYVALYVDTALLALRRVDPDVAFIDSSPSNGVVSTEPYVKRWGDVQSPHRGDVHYYNYAADCEDAGTYPRARFVSEHGFQSFPALPSYRHVLAPEDHSPNSSQLFWRQRHPQGQEQLRDMLRRHFRLPQGEDFGGYLYLSQVQQARCYETAFAQWRRLRSAADAGTMGILYWQLNDIWPGPSWSSLEHLGSWRLAHSAAQRSFAPLFPSLLLRNGSLEAFLSSDLTSPVSARLTVSLQPLAGGSARAWFACDVAGLAAGTRLCGSAELAKGLNATGCNATKCLAILEGEVSAPEKRALPTAHSFLVQPKDAQLPTAGPQILRSEKLGAKRASLRLRADAVAAHVALEGEVPGRFVPNDFLMLPGRDVVVDFLAREDFELGAWQRSLRVRSLNTLYGGGAGPVELQV